ncbi:MAG: FAD-binding oxidoreductase [Micrococcales bacterium]|nr:FAD-binding oxidoreductase [Micrococcales bacterium]
MRKHWGWGRAEQALTAEQLQEAAPGVVEYLGFGRTDVEIPVALEAASLPVPRLTPGDLSDIADTGRHARATHALGKAYRDILRGFRGDFSSAPDFVVLPRSETDVERALHWCEQRNVAAIPFGGGTSVVGGVEPRGLDDFDGVISLDLRLLDAVLEVDPVARAALVSAGAAGPRVEEQLRPHGFTTRFFPQSFEFATVGGWIATRAGGHYASGPTHIDDVVESVRAITPVGVWESRRLPASGAGPSPDRLLLGSEGTLGVITQAWLRIVPRPEHKFSATVRFPDFRTGCDAIRLVLQSGLRPDNCRLIDGVEAPGADHRPMLVLGFEGSAAMGSLQDAALAICVGAGGQLQPTRDAQEWRGAFLQAPYLRDTLVSLGVLAETFETAVTWDRLDALVESVRNVAEQAVLAVCGHPGRVTCRLTHVYPDGAAPYFTVLAPVARGEEIAAWDEIKARVGEALLTGGGTITHHHAVGRDHVPWYRRQRPDVFAAALAASKAAVDPAWILNPGVLGLERPPAG